MCEKWVCFREEAQLFAEHELEHSAWCPRLPYLIVVLSPEPARLTSQTQILLQDSPSTALLGVGGHVYNSVSLKLSNIHRV